MKRPTISVFELATGTIIAGDGFEGGLDGYHRF